MTEVGYSVFGRARSTGERHELFGNFRAHRRADRRGGAVLARVAGRRAEPAWGSAPVIPAAKPQGRIPTLKMPTARGWDEGRRRGGAGAKVNAFATGLKHPRWIHVLPNGDVLVAEATRRGSDPDVFDYAMQAR